MDFCDGGDLFGVVERSSRLEESVAKEIFLQLVAGIAFLHEAGIAHLVACLLD